MVEISTGHQPVPFIAGLLACIAVGWFLLKIMGLIIQTAYLALARRMPVGVALFGLAFLGLVLLASLHAAAII